MTFCPSPPPSGSESRMICLHEDLRTGLGSISLRLAGRTWLLCTNLFRSTPIFSPPLFPRSLPLTPPSRSTKPNIHRSVARSLSARTPDLLVVYLAARLPPSRPSQLDPTARHTHSGCPPPFPLLLLHHRSPHQVALPVVVLVLHLPPSLVIA